MTTKTKKPVRRARRSAHPNARARRRPTPLAEQQARTLRAKALFLKSFADRGIVLRSCAAAKIGRRTVYDWLENDPTFKELYDAALEDAVDAMEDEARRRAVDGVLKPVFQGGVKVGSIREYSDSLLIAILKGRRPSIYRERFEHTGADGGPIETKTTLILKNARASLIQKLATLATRSQEEPAAAAAKP